ncbi:MAG: proline dehydrogenase family protein [Bacteroidota bacterium]
MNPNPRLTNIDFNDTARAFQAKSDVKLRRTYRMFRLIDSPFLTRIGPKLLNFALWLRLPITGIVRKTIYELFVGGESIDKSVEASQYLNQFGVKTILDYSVEGERTEAGFDATHQEFLATLIHGGKHPEVSMSACKLTGLASFSLMEKVQKGEKLTSDEQAAWERVQHRMESLALAAVNEHTPLFIDAEESWIQDAIDALAEDLMERHNQSRANVFHTVQLYRHDRLDYLQGLIARSREKGYVLGVKLVRGAYLEKENDRADDLGYPTPMQPDKAATDRDYDAALKLCIDNIDHVAVCAGTHNESSARYLTELMSSAGLAADHPHVWFAQLLGMSDHISFNLADKGYHVAKYVPYGPVRAVIPYLIRRA